MRYRPLTQSMLALALVATMAPSAVAKPKKPKLVRDSFTIPKAEYAVLAVLKLRAGKLGHAAKKSELLRAGIKVLAGLGDTPDALLSTCERLIAIGVYPFVVPFVPIAGTPLESHPAPEAAFMRRVLEPLGAMVAAAGVRAADIKAGCGKCAACSTLSRYETTPLAA